MNIHQLFGGAFPPGQPQTQYQKLCEKLGSGEKLDQREEETFHKIHSYICDHYAKIRHKMYTKYRDAGFTDEQAFQLVLKAV